MTYYVQVYKSTDLNSPPLSGQSNSGIVVLNACLVDGYSASVSITGITRSSQTATATVSAADGLKLKTGQILTIAGAGETEYNITATITVASTTTFTYTVSGTPATPATGTITGTLKLPITSITRGGTGNLTATVTIPNANETFVTGERFTIEGCTSTGAAQYNGTFQITKLSATSFTYQMASDPGANATVSSTTFYYKAGLQWTRPFSAGTNSQTYLSQATVGALGETYYPRYLQVVDNAATAGGAKEAQVYGVETMSGDQSGIIGAFPTTTTHASGLCFRKSTTAATTVREWTIYGDEKTFTIISNTGDAAPYFGFTFGYFIPIKSGDKYNTFIAGTYIFNSASNPVNGPMAAARLAQATLIANGGFWICRSMTQQGSALASSFCCISSTASLSGSGPNLSGANMTFLTYPHSPDNAFYIQPLFIQDSVGILRGRMPGVYVSICGINFSQYDTITNAVGLSGVTLIALNTSYGGANGQEYVDQFGPWT